MRIDPAASDNLLTYGMSHWSFVGVTVFVVIEPRGCLGAMMATLLILSLILANFL